jgi:hypothetical protein
MVAAGDIVYASDVQTVKDYTTGRPLVRLIQQTSQTGNASGGNLVLTFGAGSEDIDTHGYHDEVTNNTRVTPLIAGYYRIVVKPVLAASTTITSVNAYVRKNGSAIERSGNHKPSATSATNTAGGIALEAWLTANGTTDYFEGGVTALTSAGTWDTNGTAGSTSTLQVEFMRPL